MMPRVVHAFPGFGACRSGTCQVQVGRIRLTHDRFRFAPPLIRSGGGRHAVPLSVTRS